MSIRNTIKNKAVSVIKSKKALNRARMAHRVLSVAGMLACCVIVPAFAADEALTAITKLSDMLFAIIKVVGLISAGWGVVQIGLSVQSHDASQRTQGILCVLGGLLIYFAKTILDSITG